MSPHPQTHRGTDRHPTSAPAPQGNRRTPTPAPTPLGGQTDTLPQPLYPQGDRRTPYPAPAPPGGQTGTLPQPLHPQRDRRTPYPSPRTTGGTDGHPTPAPAPPRGQTDTLPQPLHLQRDRGTPYPSPRTPEGSGKLTRQGEDPALRLAAARTSDSRSLPCHPRQGRPQQYHAVKHPSAPRGTQVCTPPLLGPLRWGRHSMQKLPPDGQCAALLSLKPDSQLVSTAAVVRPSPTSVAMLRMSD
uniref:Uncharacterized protein n=1 Tax=Myotis myotis TaxID=51298 RepID=A0A7J7TIN2_MYOMY|nr:hypothetical protein mMyoMyo1_009114 [Myotis myotis]